MQIFPTESSLEAATLISGQTVLTQGRVTAGDGLGRYWLIKDSGEGITLANGKIAVQQQYTPAREAIIDTATPPDGTGHPDGTVWYIIG